MIALMAFMMAFINAVLSGYMCEIDFSNRKAQTTVLGITIVTTIGWYILLRNI